MRTIKLKKIKTPKYYGESWKKITEELEGVALVGVTTKYRGDTLIGVYEILLERDIDEEGYAFYNLLYREQGAEIYKKLTVLPLKNTEELLDRRKFFKRFKGFRICYDPYTPYSKKKYLQTLSIVEDYFSPEYNLHEIDIY